MINHGPVILAANHQSFLDPPLAGSVSDRAIYFLARKTLLDPPLLGWLLPKLNVIPVDSETGRDRTALKALIRILRAGQGTVVFRGAANARRQASGGATRAGSGHRQDAGARGAGPSFRRIRRVADPSEMAAPGPGNRRGW